MLRGPVTPRPPRCAVLLLLALPWAHFDRGGLHELTREWTWIPLGTAGVIVPVLDLGAERGVSLGVSTQDGAEPVVEWTLDGVTWHEAPVELRGGLRARGRTTWMAVLPRLPRKAGEGRLVALRVSGAPGTFPALVRY